MAYTLKITEIRKESQDTITLVLKKPALKKINYMAGQYVTLVFRINGRRYMRPYSFSSSPNVDLSLEVTIKRVSNGIVSNYIHDCLKVGDSVEMLAPMGDFVLKGASDCVVLWGVGSGITPLFSIIKEILYNTDSNVILVYGNKYLDDCIFRDKLLEMQINFHDRVKIKHFISRGKNSHSNYEIEFGRLTTKHAENILNGIPEAWECSHYICGPIDFKATIMYVLRNVGVKSSAIFFEDFEMVVSKEDLIGVVPSEVQLDFANNFFKFDVEFGKSVLDSALDANVELPYSCQTGNCITCKATLIEGELKSLQPKEHKEYLADREYLLCCSYPLSKNLIIKIN